MTFDQMLAESRELTREQAEVNIRELMTDPRFTGVLRLLSDHQATLTIAACGLEVAASPAAATLQAHHLGSIDALLNFEAILRGLHEGEQI